MAAFPYPAQSVTLQFTAINILAWLIALAFQCLSLQALPLPLSTSPSWQSFWADLLSSYTGWALRRLFLKLWMPRWSTPGTWRSSVKGEQAPALGSSEKMQAICLNHQRHQRCPFLTEEGGLDWEAGYTEKGNREEGDGMGSHEKGRGKHKAEESWRNRGSRGETGFEIKEWGESTYLFRFLPTKS